MLQAIMTEPGKIELVQIDQPTIRDDQVLMQTKRIGVCGSDIHVYHGTHPYTEYPVVQGHEVAGVVAAVGSAVTGLAVGDRITFAPQIVCGECYPCRHGMPHICNDLKVMGFQASGAAQEFVALPSANVFKVPDHISLDHTAFVEPVAVAVHALRRAGDVRGQHVLVLGAGTIGNLTAQCAKALGAAAVMITDISDYKLEKARACNIGIAVNTTSEDLGKAIMTHFPGQADLILECVGVQATIDQAVATARKGTTIVVVGVFGTRPLVDLAMVQDRELSLVGTLMYQNVDYEKAIKLIADQKLHLDPLLTHRFAFKHYLDAYHTIEKSGGEYLKVMIEL